MPVTEVQPPGLRQPSPRTAALAAAAGVLAVTGILFLRNPASPSSGLPPCLWHVATGTYCPGCGITRSLHALLHGDVLAALGYNAVGLLVLLTTTTVLLRPGWIAVTQNRWTPPALPRHTARWLIITGLAWALLRNLPWEPFTVLAP